MRKADYEYDYRPGEPRILVYKNPEVPLRRVVCHVHPEHKDPFWQLLAGPYVDVVEIESHPTDQLHIYVHPDDFNELVGYFEDPEV